MPTAGSLAVMSKYPLLQRPHRYATGGALAVMSKYPLLSRPHRYATGGAARGTTRTMRRPAGFAKGRGPLAAALAKIPLLGMIMGPIAEAFGKGAMKRHRVPAHVRMTHQGPTVVRSHLAHGKGGAALRKGIAMMAPRMLAAMAAKGRGGARRARRPVSPNKVNVAKLLGMGGRSAPRPHRVRPHMSHTRTGQAVMVRGYTTGRGMLMPAGAGMLSPAGGRRRAR